MGVTSAVAAVVGAVGTVVSYQSNKEAQKEQKKQYAESQAIAAQGREKDKQLADLQTMRAKRAAAREAQMKRAEISANAEQRGVQSSVIQGAQGSVATQAGSNISFLDSANKLSSQSSALFGQAQAVGSRPIQVNGTGSMLQGFGGSVFSVAKGNSWGNIWDGLDNMFSNRAINPGSVSYGAAMMGD